MTAHSGKIAWFDIDYATREQMLRAVDGYVLQLVTLGAQLTYDVEHWNRINDGKQPPIAIGPLLEIREKVKAKVQDDGERFAARKKRK